MPSPHLVLGNDNAESDALLYHCSVRRSQAAESKPILMGRWGTGKSALLLLKNKDLQSKLKEVDRMVDRDWLISEKALDVRSLHELKKDLGSPDELKRSLEELWKTEIIRVAAKLLTHLRSHYGNPQGRHWDQISKVANSEIGNKPVWSHASMLLKALLSQKFGSAETRALENSVRSLIDNTTLSNVQRCLLDVEASQLQICVAIEPIETPTSALEEDNSLAQTLVTALINCFRNYFEPSERQKLHVMISIPWHRYDIQQLDFPQKLDQYVARLKWSHSELRNFISRRIDWELQRVGNPVANRGVSDAWDALFPKWVTNGHCDPKIAESSFGYVTRHTHHRARHLQGLARKAIEVQAEISNCSVDEVLRGKHQLTEEGIKKAVKDSNRLATEELLTEAQRKMPVIRDLVKACLTGMPVPFSEDELSRRIKRSNVDMPYLIAREMLFTCGFLGLMLTPRSSESVKHLNTILDDENRRVVRLHDNSKAVLPRWFWFHYNCDGDLGSQFDIVKRCEDADASFVMHPKSFEWLYPGAITKEFPIGI